MRILRFFFSFLFFFSWKCHNAKMAFNVGFVLFMQNIFKNDKCNWVSLTQAVKNVPKKLLFPLKYYQPYTFTVNQKMISSQIMPNQKVLTSWEILSCINFHQIFLSDLSLLQPCRHGEWWRIWLLALRSSARLLGDGAGVCSCRQYCRIPSEPHTGWLNRLTGEEKSTALLHQCHLNETQL